MLRHIKTGPNSGCPSKQVVKHSCKNPTSNLLSHMWILTTSYFIFFHHLIHSDTGSVITDTQKPGPCSSHLLMPVLSKPHHLIHNALQGGQQGWMQFPLHMHDSAAAPHRGCGSDWPRVGSTRVRQGTHRTRLLLPWSIWWRSNVEKQTIITLVSSKMTGGSLTNVSLMHFNAIQHTVASYVYIPLLYRSLCSILSVR